MGGAVRRSLVIGVLGALLLPAVSLANPAPFTVTKGVHGEDFRGDYL